MASGSTRRQGFNREVMYGIAAVPTSNTRVSATDTLLFQLSVKNITAAGITLVMTNNATVPLTTVSVTVPANSNYIINAADGEVWLSGIWWQAGGVGLVGEIYAMSKSSGS